MKDESLDHKNQTYDKRWAIVSIASIPLVMTLGNSMLIPVLPTMEKELNISAFQSSLIITVYSVIAIIFIPIAGYLSDKWGRKIIIIPSLIIAGIGGLLSGWASIQLKEAYTIILIGRMLQGIGAAGAFPIVLPLVGDMFRKEKDVSSTLGVIETSNTLGKVLSPILGAFLAGFYWFLPFFAFPLFCLISIIMMIFLVKSPKNKQEALPFKQFLKKMKVTFKREGRWLVSLFLIGGILMFILFGVLFFLSSMLEERYHIGDLKKGFMLAIPLGALCLASYITGKRIHENKVLMKWVSVIGIVVMTVSVFLLNVTNHLWLLIAFFVFSGVGIGVCLPCLDSLITEGIEKDERGTITSLYSSMRFVGVAAGPPVIALVMKNNENILFYGIAILGAITAFICFKGIRPEDEKNENLKEGSSNDDNN